MIEPHVLIFLLGTIGIFGAFFIGGYIHDRRKWNNGIDASSGQPWIFVQMDSQGGRQYDSGYNSIWITYPYADRY